MSALSPPHDLPALARLSARVGADPLLIQGAGGNTSIKESGVLWIKASGALLAEALARDVFVPCDLVAMRAALAAGEARADKPAEFSLRVGGLRPSIETSLHAVFPQRVVVHVHCVNTIALAIRADAEAALAERLTGFDWAFVPYARPGARLARAVADRLRPQTDVVVLGNHGLIVAAESVAAAEALLERVVRAVKAAPRLASAPDLAALAGLSDAAYAPAPPGHPLHGVALDDELLAAATGGTLYPDHVVFCGPGARIWPDDDRGRPFLLVPEAGAMIRLGASAGALALSRCLGDVLARLAPGARPHYLTAAQEAELMDWDAEKHRRALNGEASR